MALADEIRAAVVKHKSREVHLESIGTTVRVVEPSLTFACWIRDQGEIDTQDPTEAAYIFRRVVAACTVDESGSKVFDCEDNPTLMMLPMDCIEPIVNAVMEMMTKEPELVGN